MTEKTGHTMTEKTGHTMKEPLVYEISAPGRCGLKMPEPDVPFASLPEDMVRDDLPLPELAQIDVIRHYLRLSQLNYGVDKGFYPLGSCTMKYNPKVNEEAARIPGLALTHPLQDPQDRKSTRLNSSHGHI